MCRTMASEAKDSSNKPFEGWMTMVNGGAYNMSWNVEGDRGKCEKENWWICLYIYIRLRRIDSTRLCLVGMTEGQGSRWTRTRCQMAKIWAALRCRCYGHLDFLDRAKDALAKADWFERVWVEFCWLGQWTWVPFCFSVQPGSLGLELACSAIGHF